MLRKTGTIASSRVQGALTLQLCSARDVCSMLLSFWCTFALAACLRIKSQTLNSMPHARLLRAVRLEHVFLLCFGNYMWWSSCTFWSLPGCSQDSDRKDRVKEAIARTLVSCYLNLKESACSCPSPSCGVPGESGVTQLVNSINLTRYLKQFNPIVLSLFFNRLIQYEPRADHMHPNGFIAC